MNSKRICLLLVLLLTTTCLVSAQEALPDSVAAEPADTVTTAVDSVAAPVTPQRMQPKVTPVDIDDKKQTPVLHYYDKHGDPLDEPVMFLATLDTVTKAKSRPVYPLYNGVSVGLNFADAVMMAFKQRYASFDGGIGKEFEEGKLSLEDVYAYGKKVNEPKQTSGKQELYEAIVNMYC